MKTSAGSHDDGGQCRVESAPDLFRGRPGEDILDYASHDVRGLDDDSTVLLVELRRVHSIRFPFGQRLELHGRLGFEVHAIPETEEAGHGVEERAGAG